MKRWSRSHLCNNRLSSALHPVDSSGLLVCAEVSRERDDLHVGEDVLRTILIDILAVKDWFKDHDSLMFQLQLTNIRLMANSVALLNMFIPMASPERATNLIGAIS